MIKKSNNQKDIVDTIKKAKELGLEISEFTREMILTSDDKKVKDLTSSKKYEEIEYL
jgi:ribosomal protein S18